MASFRNPPHPRRRLPTHIEGLPVGLGQQIRRFNDLHPTKGHTYIARVFDVPPAYAAAAIASRYTEA